MNRLINRIATILSILILGLTAYSCASLGSKTLYNDTKPSQNEKVDKICIAKPTLENIDFYNTSAQDFYESEVSRLLNEKKIKSEAYSSIIVDFDSFNINSTLEEAKLLDCDFVLLGKVIRLTSMGMTRDFKVEYKLISPIDGKLKYHSKYSTTFGKTYVIVPGGGMPTEEQLMRDAIKSGLYNLENEILEK